MIKKIEISDYEKLKEIIISEDAQNEIVSFKDLDINYDKVYETIKYWILSEDSLTFLDEENGEITGFILGATYSPWCANDKYAVEYILYVRKQYRGGKIATKLLNKFNDEAIKLGCKEIHTAVVISNDNSRTRLKFLSKYGYETSMIYLKKCLKNL